METRTKTITAAVKCPDPADDSRTGQLSLVVATLGAIDKHDEVVQAGSIGRQDVVISPFQHGVWRGGVPIGKGVLYEQGGLVQFDGTLNMELSTARDNWSAIAFAKELTEVSFGFRVLRHSFGQQEGRPVVFLHEIKAYEVSPVMLGAGVGTGVTAIKSADAVPTAEIVLHTPASIELLAKEF